MNEDELFGKEETVKAKESVVDDQINKTVDRNQVSFNGFINARMMYDMNRDWMSGTGASLQYNTFTPYLQGNFALDARLTGGYKGYINFSANYYPNGTSQSMQLQTYNPATMSLGASQLYFQNTTTSLGINEIFIDLNIAKAVYFRVGKQNLVWGTGLLWVPTDLINIDKKNILDPSQVRQGTYGLKMTIPFGTRANWYTYIKLDPDQNVTQFTMANKFELLLGVTELALSAVINQFKVPVFGFNFTTRLFTLDFRGEITLSYGDDYTRKVNLDALSNTNTTLPTYYLYNQLVPKISVGFGRSFELFSVPNNFRFDVEFFYNYAGYNNNSKVFGRTMNFMTQNISVNQMFASSSAYTPYYYGMYYLGLFLSLAQVGTSDLSMGLNYIINLSDYSSVLAYSINYMLHYNLTLSLLINGYFGYPNTEFTTYFTSSNAVAARGMSAELLVKLAF
jgi:hypothetical protein